MSSPHQPATAPSGKPSTRSLVVLAPDLDASRASDPFEVGQPQVLWWPSFLVCLLMLSGPAAQAQVIPGPTQVILSGRPAPTPSSSACGLVFVAHETGPQVMFTERPGSAALALDEGETVEFIIPLRGASGELQVSAEALPLSPGEATVSLAVNGAASTEARLGLESKSLAVRFHAADSNLVLRLLARTRSTQASVLWRGLRVSVQGREIPLPLSVGARDVDVCPAPVLPPLRPALAQFLVEWDWRMQDGIGTERAASTFAEATTRTLQRARALRQDLEARGLNQSVSLTSWLSLEHELKQLAESAPASDARWEDLWRKVHRARRELALSNPLFNGRSIAFVKQVPSVFSHQLTQYYGSCARPGGGVFLLESPGLSMASRQLTPPGLPQGSCQHLDLSPDGKRLLFAWCAVPSSPRNREEHLDRFYHIFEMAADGTGLRQLTDGPYDDFSPRYLPGGGLLFISTRRGGFHRCGRGPCPVYTLCLAQADGSDAHPVSYHETHEWDPAVLHDGRIVYTRWDYVDRHAVYYEQLWSARPDGSGVRIFYGNNTFNPVGVWEARPVPGSDQIMATAGAHHAMTAGSIILIDPAREPDGLEPVTRLTPDALFPESEAPVVLKPNGAWSAPAGLKSQPTIPAEAARWPGHCYRSPFPLAENCFLAAYSFDALVGEPTWNRANMFGLYLVDGFGNKELLYRDLNLASLWPTLLEARKDPATVSPAAETATAKEGVFFIQNVHASWPSLPREKITSLRIVQVVPKSTPHANTPPVGLANASPGRQVLGAVPVEEDGSAYFRAPAGIPLSFQALDQRGQAIQIMRSLTYLQPGETASCIGCHEHRTTSPPLGRRPVALNRSPSTITPAPDGANPLSYPRLVQPVLDRHCVSCHNPAKPDGKVVLTGSAQGQYTFSYQALAPRVAYSAWGSKDGDFRQVNSEPASQPGFFGARGSPSLLKLFTDHYGVALSQAELERLIIWMDANALFYGTFDPQDQARQLRGELIAGPKVQ
jgi:hypothetical protein